MVDPVTILGFITLILSNVTNADLDVCDFSSNKGSIHNGRSVLCRGNIEVGKETQIICPALVNSYYYSFFPNDVVNQTYAYSPLSPKTLGGPKKLHKAHHSEVYGSLNVINISLSSNHKSSNIILNIDEEEILAKHSGSHMIYICISRSAAMEEKFFEELDERLDKISNTETNKKYISMDKLSFVFNGEGIGIAYLRLITDSRAIFGCGNIPTRLFFNAMPNKIDSEPYSCAFDARQAPYIGFYCTEELDPPECFKKMIGNGGNIVDMSSFITSNVNNKGLTTTEFRPLIQIHYPVACRCRDRLTRKILAQLTINPNNTTRHVCNVMNMQMRNRAQDADGYSCDVVLNPGDSVEIIFTPENGYYDAKLDKYLNYEGRLENTVSVIFPVDIGTHCYYKRSANRKPFFYGSLTEVFGPGTIDIDQSRRSEGIIVIKHNEKYFNKEFDDIVRLSYESHIHNQLEIFPKTTKANIQVTIIR
ncbi:bifunctional 6-Cysteine (6-Cys) domain/6-Cysteine (6-Cys) domain superfamily [Babesia duncani]|uniref:Bifunctional 6-Cysteine (6-Cys) domain/6-Cysteine (6-Cys) domain superfamily n=1 Tax=Babesia duncani TaxID=323732 RepID=A0AAD9UNC7_9APIC|nr:bifunctional 6-Cysteine (6-Cys) domain/6-Cysteine (6-Cys) domain superfamily [Babesia duncani]